MRIQYFNGGLANQVFQYIFYRHAQLATGNKYTWFLDDSFFFFKDEHNGYELEKVFGLKPNLLSRYFSPDAWNHFIENRKNGIGTAQTMLNMGIDIKMIAEASNYTTANPFHGPICNISTNEYHPEILDVPGQALYYFGYWINKHWLDKYRDQILSELSFPPILDAHNLSYASKIKSTLSVGVHIRRGDFITLGWEINPETYHAYCKMLFESYPELTFFVFSDDILWCKENACQLGLSLAKECIFVEGNTSGSNYIDLQLMSMCKGLLMSNSSFSYLAALMNNNLQFYINPLTYREV
ncbi:MAG: alpha-1,2-fucosyltransferase [Lachnospiraceae bacterium]|nr:alpha-1,2-fucosyltransferase [Lachnospiraceae bacterium]